MFTGKSYNIHDKPGQKLSCNLPFHLRTCRLRYDEAAEVCLLNVFKAESETEAMSDWLLEHHYAFNSTLE